MLENIPHFDMSKSPEKPKLNFIIWLSSFFSCLKHKTKIQKVNMQGIKPPYILLCNHNAFFDFKVAAKATFPHRTNSVVAIDGFIKREKLLRAVGGICKRKFTNDAYLVRQIKKVLDNKNIIVIYPEARYSLCGTNTPLLESVGKLVKLMKVPVVTLINHGHHINHPFWNTSKERGVKPTSSTMTCIATSNEITNLTAEEITKKVNDAFVYDDFAWQKENKVKVTCKSRAEGLEKVLYQCPHCLKENQMETKDFTLHCKNCNYSWVMNEYGELMSENSFDPKFSHIPTWYEWERANVRKEIFNKKYSLNIDVHVDALPNAKGFIHLGKGKLTHDLDGFILKGNYEGEDYEYRWNSKSQYAVHIEYNYLFKFGDCIDLNTLNDTFYIYPEGKDFSVTKISLATEEMYKILNQNS